MTRLLEKLIHGNATCEVKPEMYGYSLVAKPGRIDDFSDLVREAEDNAGVDYVVFPTIYSGKGYSEMFVIPLDRINAV